MQGQQEQAITFEQKINILQNITLFPALTIMVFLRRKVGFRFLDLMKIQVMVVLLWAYGAFSSITFGPSAGGIIFLFSLAVLIAAIIERRIRWRDIKRGISWHTYSRGISWFSSFLPLPEIMVRRFIDPAAALIPGVALFFLFRPLGLYLILSAVCLFVFETIDYQKQIDRMLDQLDNLVESEVVSDNVEYFQQGGAAGARPVEETAGIPTGTDPDLAAAIERRRARSQKGQQIQKPPLSQPPLVDSHSMRLPQSLQGYQQQEQVISEPSLNVPRRRNLPPDNLVITDSSEPSSLPPPQPAAAQSQQGIPVIQSPNDPAFAALPSGAEFMTPDGKTRRKK
jgi:hypothetical protein